MMANIYIYHEASLSPNELIISDDVRHRNKFLLFVVIQHIYSFNMLNWFKGYKTYNQILNRILDLAWPN